MKASHSQRLPGLDHLRATAILLVLLFHYKVYYGLPAAVDIIPLNVISTFGWTGVDLFFVLSGFLIGRKLMQDMDEHGQIRFGNFYLNRALRILPAYLVAVALYFLVTDIQEGRALQPLWRFLTFTTNLHQDLYANTFSHAWSLAIEEHFYLLLPLLLFLLLSFQLRKYTAVLILTFVLAGILVRYINFAEWVEDKAGRDRLGMGIRFLYYPTYARLDGLITGVAIAALYIYRPKIWQGLMRYDLCLAGAGLAGLVTSYIFFGGNILSGKFTYFWQALFGFPLISVSYGLVLMAALKPESLIFKWRNRFTAIIAMYAYSIYLVHKMSNHWLNKNLKTWWDMSDVTVFVLSLVTAILAGGVLFYLVERPFLILRNRIQNPTRPTAKSSPAKS